MRRSVARLSAIAAVFSMAAMVGCEPSDLNSDDAAAREAAADPPDPPDPNAWLVDVTATTGVDFIHTTGGTGELYLPEIMGGGVAVFDADGDDRLDLYFTNQNGLLPKLEPSTTDVNRLYRQMPDGRFEDITEASGLGDGGYGMGVAIGDVDNDGDLDVYVSNYGADRLYLNDGGGVFEDATERSGIIIDGLSASCAFFDYDRDGDLDLYVAEYVLWDETQRCTSRSGQRTYCGPLSFRAARDHLLRNEGGGRFVDVSEESGIARVFAAGLGVVIEDFDHDGWPDLSVANDGYANNLWLNQRNGRFVDDALMLGAAYNDMGQPEAGMGVLAEDLDRDGRVDLFVTHLDEETNTLYRGLPGRTGFADATATATPGQ
ncbi:MAG: VCBS repeat-containing protein, partial [Myxococcota bacterium]